MSQNTYRPRISRERRDKVIEAAGRLNGADVSFHESLGLLCRYLDVLHGDVACPECGATDVEDREHGRYHCWRCEEDRGNGLFTAWDYLDVADRDSATLPGTKESVQYRFESDSTTTNRGTNSSDSVSDTQNQQADTAKNHGNQWDNGF